MVKGLELRQLGEFQYNIRNKWENQNGKIAMGQGSNVVNIGNERDLNQHYFLMDITGQLQLVYQCKECEC
jgi:hypothetical protein